MSVPVLGVLPSLGVPGDPRGGIKAKQPPSHRAVCRWHIPSPSRSPAAHGGAACSRVPALASQRGQEGGGFTPDGDPASASTARGSPATCSATDIASICPR